MDVIVLVQIDDGNKEFVTQLYFRDDVPRGFSDVSSNF